MKKNTCTQHEIVRTLNEWVGEFQIEMEIEECCYEDYVLTIKVDWVLKKDLSFGACSLAKNFAWGFVAWMEQLAKELKELL